MYPYGYNYSGRDGKSAISHSLCHPVNSMPSPLALLPVCWPRWCIWPGSRSPTALAFAAGCAVGLVVTPDLDVRQRSTHSETIMRHSGGCLGGVLWSLLWLPYAYLIPRHRRPLSHWPVIGTALRLLYLLAVPAVA